MSLRLFVLISGFVSACAVSAKDVEISIDTVNNGAVITYELKDLGIAGDGPIKVNAISKGAAPVDPTYPLVITQSTGGLIKANPAPPYICTGGVCPDVQLSYEIANPVDYSFDTWAGDCAKDAKQPTCTLKMSSARAVSAIFKSSVVVPPAADCKPEGTTLVEVPTDLPNSAFPRTNYRPSPSTVHAFAFKTKPAGAMAVGQFAVTVLSSAIGGKLIVVSECRGDVGTVLTEEKTGGCIKYATETAVVDYVVNASPKYAPKYWCNLKPNTQYYLNVIARSTTSGPALCSDVSNCAFSFTGQ